MDHEWVMHIFDDEIQLQQMLIMRWYISQEVEEHNVFFILGERMRHTRIPDFHERWIDLYWDFDFYQLFRMTRQTFQQLLRAVNIEQREFTGGEIPINVEKILLMTLWWLGKGETLNSVGDKFNVAVSTVHDLTSAMLIQIINCMNKYIVWPHLREAQDIEQHFREKANFPGIIGAVDGCNINFKCPEVQQASYIDKNLKHSIKLQGIVTADKIFTNISCGFPGSVHDSRVLKNSQIYIDIQDRGNYSKYFFEDYHLVGDKAYMLLKWLLTPYKDTGRLTAKAIKYNTYLSKCRIVVEHTFGILKTRWRILQLINVNSIEKDIQIICACCVLHNFCYLHSDFWDNYEPVQYEDVEEIHGGMQDERVIKRSEIANYINGL